MKSTPASYPARTHARKHANTRTHTRTHTQQHPGTARHTARRSRHARMSSARQGKRREHCYKHVRAKTTWGHVRHFSHFSHKQRVHSAEHHRAKSHYRPALWRGEQHGGKMLKEAVIKSSRALLPRVWIGLTVSSSEVRVGGFFCFCALLDLHLHL